MSTEILNIIQIIIGLIVFVALFVTFNNPLLFQNLSLKQFFILLLLFIILIIIYWIIYHFYNISDSH